MPAARMDNSTSTIRVAILGGGLAAIALLKGLLKYPHVVVDIYESRPAFREEGPAVELSEATLTALRMIEPSLDQCLARAGALLTSTEVRLATGSLSGQVIIPGGSPGSFKTVVSRQALLSELTAGLPPRAMHFNARVTAIREVGSSLAEGATLIFGDGSQKRYDVVVGADRVQGNVARRRVLLLDGGSNAMAAEPQRPTGFWGLHATVPLERAQGFMGTEFFGLDRPAQVRWVGDGTFMQHELVNGGRDVQVVVYTKLGRSATNGDESPWVKLFTPEEFEEMFAGCRPDVCKGIVKLFQSIYTVHIAGFLETHPSSSSSFSSPSSSLTTPETYISEPPAPRACLLSSAALALAPPFHSRATASLAIEEALLLSALIGRAAAVPAVLAALRAFDRVCRPHALRVARASSEATRLFAGVGAGSGVEDAGRLAAAIGAAWEGEDGNNGGGARARLAAAVGVMEQVLMGGGMMG